MKRWPTILTQVIDQVVTELHDLPSGSDKVKEGQAIIQSISALKYDISRDRPLVPLDAQPGEDVNIDIYNTELERLTDQLELFTDDNGYAPDLEELHYANFD